MIAVISPVRLAELHRAGRPVKLIDVRTPAEYRELHVAFARNVPLDRLDPKSLANEETDAAEPLYVICRSGSRGRQACEKLAAAGLANVINVDGGTQAWDAAGLPLVHGQKTISLERQVRIAAGFLVLTSSVLGFFVHPAWLAIAAFVGAGLMFAGITDTCGMAMMLARMPWNRAGGSCSVAAPAARSQEMQA